jgi:hypothetical protein
MTPEARVGPVVRHYRKVLTLEPAPAWKAAHQESLQILIFEETIGRIANALDSILKMDLDLQSLALASPKGGEEDREYESWTASMKEMLTGLEPALRTYIENAVEKKGYFGYKDPKYSREDFKALLDRIGWCVHPDPAAGLRPAEAIEKDYRDGRCDRFPEK